MAAEAKKSDIISRLIIIIGLLGALALIPDWSTFATLGKTSATTVIKQGSSQP